MNELQATVDAIYRRDSRRVFATLIRLIGDFDLAEEALHDAFKAAIEQWPRDGVPANPSAWLVSAGRFKAIDGIRRRARFSPLDDEHAESLADDAPGWDEREELEDDRLRLIFTCCHPSLAPDAQVALTLREVCGLTTEEIASAFLTPAPTLAQRIVRATTHRWFRSPGSSNRARRPRPSSRTGTSWTTGFASSSPAATPRCSRTRRSRSRCAPCAG